MLVTDAERDRYVRRGVARWFRETEEGAEGASREPFEPVTGWPGYHRIRARAGGACGFLSAANRCRLHEEMGAAGKPLTCRMFPFTFHPTPTSVVVTASFGCPTIVENRGEPVSGDAMRRALDAVYRDHRTDHGPVDGAFPVHRGAKREDGRRPVTTAGNQRHLVAGRGIDAPSICILRESLLRMLARADNGAIDLRANVHRMAVALDDLTRSRVLRLADEDFAEYIKLTLPFAAARTDATPASPQLMRDLGPRRPGRVGRLMQFAFLYLVAATRYAIEHRGDAPWSLRLARLRLLAHFHRLAPAVDRVNVRALRHRVDINEPAVQPVAYHYLRASIEALGARQRPVLDDFAIAVSCLNAACALAVMNAHAAGRAIDRDGFSRALMESVDLLHLDERGLMGWVLPRLASGVDALHQLSDGR